VTSGKQWEGDKLAYGLRGWIKVVEVTRGDNGWHVHVHALMIWDDDLPLDSAERCGRRMWRRWDAALRRQCGCCGHREADHTGFGACDKHGRRGQPCECPGFRGFDSLEDVGLDVRMASLDPKANGLHEYFVKLSHEIAGGQAKLAKGGGRTPFQILSDVFTAGEFADVMAWREWETASRGRRQMAWSKGLREWAGLRGEQTDEEIAAEELGDDDVMFIDPASWRDLRQSPAAVCDLLEAAESGGYPAAKRWLGLRGFIYRLVGRVGPAQARMEFRQ
jgi:hypothetical protein